MKILRTLLTYGEGKEGNYDQSVIITSKHLETTLFVSVISLCHRIEFKTMKIYLYKGEVNYGKYR